MSKPFLILNVVDGKPGVIRERPTREEAINCATELVLEQHDTPDGMTRVEFEKSIRQELTNDLDWWRKGESGFAVYILQTEDD